MIRVLTEGIRRGELLGMTMSALPDDLIRNPVIRVVPLVLLTPSSARAFAVYLRVRRSHRLADSEWVAAGHAQPRPVQHERSAGQASPWRPVLTSQGAKTMMNATAIACTGPQRDQHDEHPRDTGPPSR